MDLWDVTKLMARRWYVALPMLLLTIVAALWMTMTVKPDYEATTNVTLLPPTLRNDAATGRAQQVNPWDTESLTIATLTYLNSKRLHDQMAAEGYSQVWSADTDIRFRSLIIIKVTASGADKAQGTARKLQELVTAEVARQQDRYNLKQGEEITTIPFDNGDNLETKTSKAKRALIVVGGVGVILTIAFTVGLDAFLRWRSGRRRGGGPAGPAVPGQRAPSSPPSGVPAALAEPIVVRTLSTTTPTGGKPVTNGSDHGEQTRAIPLGIRYQTASGESTDDHERTQAINLPADRLPPAEDATIVLPLSNPPWGKKPDKSGDKAAEIGKR